MKLTPFKLAAIAAFAATAFCGQAMAVGIVGNITINSVTDPVLNSTSLATATGLNSGAIGIVTSSSSGDYAGFVGTIVTYNAFDWSPASVPEIGLWSFAGASFDLLTLTVNTHTTTFLDVRGTGILHLVGKDSTAGTWAFQINDSDGSPNENFMFAFSSSNAANIPDSGTTALLIGVGLVGVALAARRFQRPASVRS